MQLLAEGGSFVIKVYSLLTRFSVGLFYLLYNVFKEVSLAAYKLKLHVHVQYMYYHSIFAIF